MGAIDHNPLAGNDKYLVVRRLGEGSMGEVFLGQHIALDKPVVIKVILAELASSEADVDRMRLEAQALARLDHPNIVRVVDFAQTPEGRPFMVMDFLAGHTLAEEVRQRGGALPVVEAVEIARQAASGLAGAHHAGLVHRDLKLENLFLCDHRPAPGTSPVQPRTVKLIDFGLAKTVEGVARAPSPLAIPTQLGFIVGTPAYLAPEQAAGRVVDHRADIYALGLVMYALIVGRGPFDDSPDIAALIEAQLSRTPEPPSRYASQVVPPELDALVLRCLAKQPEARPRSATELSGKLASLFRRLCVAGDATTPRSRPAAIGGGAFSAAAPVAGGAEPASTGSPVLPSLASTLPMDTPKLSDTAEDLHAEHPVAKAATVPMPAQPAQELSPALASTLPMADPDELSLEAVPMGELLGEPVPAMRVPSGAPAVAAAPSGLVSHPPPAAASPAVAVPSPAAGPPAEPRRRSLLAVALLALVVVVVAGAATVLALWWFR